jgi:hypothetical protein
MAFLKPFIKEGVNKLTKYFNLKFIAIFDIPKNKI